MDYQSAMHFTPCFFRLAINSPPVEMRTSTGLCVVVVFCIGGGGGGGGGNMWTTDYL